MKFPERFYRYIVVLSHSLLSDKIPGDKKVELMDRIEDLLEWAERQGQEAADAEYLSWRPIASLPVGPAAPTELEMFRADHEAVQAHGFHDAGELLAAYKHLAEQDNAKQRKIDDLTAELWNRSAALASAGHQAAPAAPTDLHAAIMNIQPKLKTEDFGTWGEARCYGEGHRDARHAAAALINRLQSAPPREAPKPVAFMWQHEETGNVGFVDPWQVENGWQAANPRLKIVSPLYASPIASDTDRCLHFSVERETQEVEAMMRMARRFCSGLESDASMRAYFKLFASIPTQEGQRQ
jgi:hypothetical protein